MSLSLQHRRPRRFALPLLTLAWLAAVAGGSAVLWDYQSAPGPEGEAPARWPAGSRITRGDGRPTLVMFAHPKCPCTRASIEELARVVALCGERLAVHVLFCRPAGCPPAWERTELWRAAEEIPGVGVGADVGLREAERFGARTSGFVLLYGADGALLFHGGITGGRGHAGDNAGRDAVVARVTGGEAEPGTWGRSAPKGAARTCVYGCPLHGE
jgi:hypothetical protein